MSDLISRQAAIEEANEWLHDCFGVSEKQDRSVGLIRRLEDLPPAQLIDPVKHGKWEKISDRNYKCSCCNAWWSVDRRSTMKDFNYCPACGAQMERSEE